MITELVMLNDGNKSKLSEQHNKFEKMERELAEKVRNTVVSTSQKFSVLQQDCDKEALDDFIFETVLGVLAIFDTERSDLIDNTIKAKVGLVDSLVPSAIVFREGETRMHHH